MTHVSKTGAVERHRRARPVLVAGLPMPKVVRVARTVGTLIVLTLVLVVAVLALWFALDMWLELTARGLPRPAARAA